MQKRKIHSIYIAIVFTIMVLPLIMMNHRKNEISIIDNACLPELPEVSEWAYAQDTLEEYVNKRIGFREQAVYAYETANSVIFHKLEHNLYAFGENGHIMGNMPEYIEDYQHLNLEKDEEFVNAFAEWLIRVNQYLEEKNIPFLYFLAPDKKSVYPECMSQNINVRGSQSRTDMLLEQLEAQGLPYIYPREEFLKAKKENDIYYVRYDALHWNDFGNLLGNQMIDRYFCSKTRGLIPLDESQLELYFECWEKMVQSCFYVYEEVPSYGLKNEQGIMDVSEEDDFRREKTTGDFEHYINTSLSQAPSILILHDSYMVNSAKFYKGRYREVVSVHNSNYRMLQDLVEHYNPDVVLFENAERILASGTFQAEDLITGVDKKLWYNALFFLLIVILYYISTGGIHMDDIKSPSAVTIGELSRIVKEFEEKIQNGTEDPDRFLTLTEIEELWGKLIGDTNVLYSDMLQSLIQNIDERELVRQKKENSRPEE